METSLFPTIMLVARGFSTQVRFEHGTTYYP